MNTEINKKTIQEQLRYWNGEYHTPSNLLLDAAIEIDNLNNKNEKALRLLSIVEKFVKDQKISSEECVYQSDRVILNAYEFIQELCDVVGYHVEEETDE